MAAKIDRKRVSSFNFSPNFRPLAYQESGAGAGANVEVGVGVR